MTRRQRILVLAWSLPDAIRAPLTGTGAIVRKGTLSGPAPSAWAPCPASCDNGRVKDRYGRESGCQTCQGQGRVRIDVYTQEQVSTAEVLVASRTETLGCPWCQALMLDAWQGERAKRLDRLPRGTGMIRGDRCGYCDGTGWRTLTLAPGVLEQAMSRRGGPLNLSLEPWARNGSYPELLQALRRLPAWQRRGFVEAHITGLAEPGFAAAAAVETLLATMPGFLVVPAPIREAWERWSLGRTRDERIRTLHRRGAGTGAIAGTVGCSVRTVQRALYGRAT